MQAPRIMRTVETRSVQMTVVSPPKAAKTPEMARRMREEV